VARPKQIFYFIFTLRWFVGALVGLMLLLILKFYLIDIVRVNGFDMLATYNKGDVLLIQRAYNEYKTGDVIYFRYPLKDTTGGKVYCFQRLIGLPGDSVQLIDKNVFLNNFHITDTSTTKHNYYVKTNIKLDSSFIARYRLKEGGEISNDLDYSFSLERSQADSLAKMDEVVSNITLNSEGKGSFDQTVFPYSIRYSWNMDNFGKMYLPKKNDLLILDTNNIILYAPLIRDYENNKLEVRSDSIFINDKLTGTYMVKEDYYFLMGDNRDNVNDSRVFGYLPAKYIRGKVIKFLKKG
jgi:signal peptidase I